MASNARLVSGLLLLLGLAAAGPTAQAARTGPVEKAPAKEVPGFKYYYSLYPGDDNVIRTFTLDGNYDDPQLTHACAELCAQEMAGMCKGFSYCWEYKNCRLYARAPQVDTEKMFDPKCASGVRAADVPSTSNIPATAKPTSPAPASAPAGGDQGVSPFGRFRIKWCNNPSDQTHMCFSFITESTGKRQSECYEVEADSKIYKLMIDNVPFKMDGTQPVYWWWKDLGEETKKQVNLARKVADWYATFDC